MTHPTPHPQPKPLNQPKFGGIPPNAMSQFGMDLLGVWVPKIPMARSKEQLVEDAFLENVENLAFYFTIPLAAPFIAKALSWANQSVLKLDKNATQTFINDVGTSWKDLGYKTADEYITKVIATAGKDGKAIVQKMLGAKLGTLIGVVSLAGGYEYLIQHTKNVVIAKGFGTRNFTAVAGLESKQNTAVQGEMDPVAKAKKRGWQVASVMGSGFALAAATPWLVKNVSAYEKLAKNVLEVCNFNSSVGKKGKEAFFDITKPILATICGIGAVSYIDAARDRFERKETGSRLLLVIPYMLFGKELSENALAWAVGKFVKVKGKAIHDYTPLASGGFRDALKQASQPNSLLQLGLVKSEDVLRKELAAKKLDKVVIDTIVKRNQWLVKYGAFGLSALVCGVGINWMSYQQTKSRFRKEEAEKLRLRQIQLAQPSQGQTVFQSYGGFAAQGKPLEDLATAAANVVPRLQTPFQGARLSGNPYGYGQWRV